MSKSEIHVIFPVPVYKAKLDRKFSKEELRFVEKIKTKCVPNKGNSRSPDTYILNSSSLATLKKEINLFVEDYFSKILFSPKSIVPYITQSWLNYTEINEYHPPHRHSNSYLSGVFYINADKDHDQITFEEGRYDQIQFSPTKWNSFNSNSWVFPVGTGDIIMFPSYLTHLVEKKKGKNTRISLSFNVFVKGNLGITSDLTQLKI